MVVLMVENPHRGHGTMKDGSRHLTLIRGSSWSSMAEIDHGSQSFEAPVGKKGWKCRGKRGGTSSTKRGRKKGRRWPEKAPNQRSSPKESGAPLERGKHERKSHILSYS